MAGDWFPMAYYRSACPEVVRVSSATGRSRHEVLGLLCDLWSWASCESITGGVEGVWIASLSSVLGADEPFWRAVAAVNWLAEDDRGIVIPNWERWLSESAKKRSRDVIRKRVARLRGPQSVRKPSAKRPPRSGTERGLQKTEDRRQKTEEKAPPTPPCGGAGADADYRTVPADGSDDDPGRESSDGRGANRRSRNGSARDAAAAEAIVSAGGAVITPEPLEVLLAAWNATELPGAPNVRETPSRRLSFTERQADGYFRDNWRPALGRIAGSRKARGLDPKFPRGVRIEDFLDRDKNYVARIQEGEFDDPAPADHGQETAAEKMARVSAEKRGGRA